MKKSLALLLTFVLLLAVLVNCGTTKKPGDPKLVAAVEKMVEEALKCNDVKQLFKIKIDGKSIVALKNADTSKMTKKEKVRYNAAWKKYMDHELKLSKKKKEEMQKKDK